MNCVDPFKDVEQIKAIKKYLREHSYRDLLLFVMGINTGLKISEILSIKVSDVRGKGNKIKTSFVLSSDESTQREIHLNATLRNTLIEYLGDSGLSSEDYIFISPKTKKPISRVQAHRIIHDAVNALGIQGSYGASSMRKTFGYHAYKKGVSISLIQKHYQHSTPSETYKYLGIKKEEPVNTIFDVNL
ncbi:tyrosine-type recombinase/integrase [Peribacillus sp. SCS-26]|uniref:tyrosine-type recombinase/integrase n=1 Tax=Paraperibacillus marinus TaxID=3115295 RepID=UPI003905E930